MAFFATPSKFEKLQTQAPGQQQFSQQALSQAQQLLPNLLQPTDSSQIMQQRQRAFETQTVPSLAERFTALGGSGQRSSAFTGALGSAGAGLQQDLATIQEQGRQSDLNRQQQLFGALSGLGMQPSFENIFRPETPGFTGRVGSGLGAGLGSYIGSGGNPLSGLMGGLSGLLGGRESGFNANDMESLLKLLYTQFTNSNQSGSTYQPPTTA